MEPTTLPPEIAAELENLRDIHLPEPVSWWPIAPGWWALLAVTCVLILSAWGWRAYQRRTVRFQALRELDELASAPDIETTALAERLEILLKRVAMQKDRSLAALHGAGWMERLTEGPNALPHELAQFVADAPYLAGTKKAKVPDRDTLIAAVRRWIRSNA